MATSEQAKIVRYAASPVTANGQPDQRIVPYHMRYETIGYLFYEEHIASDTIKATLRIGNGTMWRGAASWREQHRAEVDGVA